jgi:hypothetical protein
MGAAKREISDILSFQLLEALLFRVQLHIFTGRCQSALAVLQVNIFIVFNLILGSQTWVA